MYPDEKYVLYGGPLTSDLLTDYKSFGEMCLAKFKVAPSTVLFENAVTSEQLTVSALRSRSVRLAECLRVIGIKPGDKIGICSENRFEFIYVLLATTYLGATAVLINPTYSKDEINHVMSLTHPRIIFATPNAIDKIIEVAKKQSYVQCIVCFGDKCSNTYAIDYNSFVNNVNIEHSDVFTCEPVDRSDNVLVILFSSGTTGVPKGVQLTQMNVLCGIAQNSQGNLTETNLGIIPWFHAYGYISILARIVNNTKVVFLPKFQEREFLSTIEKYKIKLALLVPPLMFFLAKSPLVDEYDLSSLKIIFCGAAPLSKEVEQAVKKRIGTEDIRQGYGMTEGTVGFTSQFENRKKPGSVGVLRAGIWGKVRDLENGVNLGPNKPGELLFKGNTIMKGYVGDPEATKNTIDKDGWLHSGDVGYYDKDGDWFIIDRLKELIKYKGLQVAPAELEAILLQHPKVNDVGVVGLPDEEAGELPLAFVVKKLDTDVTAEELIDFVAERVSPSKKLRGGVKFINLVPRNASGKILRKNLKIMVNKVKSKL